MQASGGSVIFTNGNIFYRHWLNGGASFHFGGAEPSGICGRIFVLATEQALLEDTGDGRGTPAVFYRGLRAVKGPADKASLDGNLAKRVTIDGESMVRLSEDSMAKRDRLEEELERLRSQKGDMDLDPYYRELERVFIQLARIKSEEPVKP